MIPHEPRGLRRKRTPLTRLALLTLGWSLLALGILGGLIPVLQGWMFGVPGAAILYLESRAFQRLVKRLRVRHPKLDRLAVRARVWLKDRKRHRDRVRASARAAERSA
ncbi:MAG: hypothetical protein JNK60_09395 [Acidobacteria bacterium]|nr:hypothetical protein [Acidobacteriota bacterium]